MVFSSETFLFLFLPLFLAAWWHVDFSKQLKAGRNSCPGV